MIITRDRKDADMDGLGDACDFAETVRDTVESGCLDLVVSNMGNYANQGQGFVNMDFWWCRLCFELCVYV